MSDRRKKLVGMAFSKIDKNGSGLVDPEDVIDVYDASKHPDVISGKKTSAEILREFLDTFDVGGEKDGKVTRNEFENYYANVSSSIDDDDYFELMIRNAWHISGGEGWSANSANRRVLVTHADGRQTVEEIKDDLGLKADDKAGMMARLRAQGVNAANISLHDGMDNTTKAKKNPDKSLLSRFQDASISDPATGRRTFQQPATNVSLAMVGAAVATSSAAPPRPATAPNLGKTQGMPNAGLQMIIQKLKQELRARGGGTGFIGLQRKFRIMDDDGSKALNLAEFKKAMKEMNMNLSDAELRMLFDHFDADGSGSIDFEEFIQGVRDPLNDRRIRLVHMAFTVLDTVGDGLVDVSDIMGRYDPSKHPDVIAGKKSPQKVLEEFLDTFDVGGEKDGKVSRTEFENYYTNIGANIDNDDYFELMIRNAWHISGGEGWSANSANRRVLVTHADGRESVEEIKNDLGLKANDKAGMIARLRAQGTNASQISLFDGVDNTSKPRTAPPTSFNELVENTSAGRSSNQLVEKSTGKKKSTNSRVFASSIVIGDDGGGDSSSSSLKVFQYIAYICLAMFFTLFIGWN
jgi:Ca2+-binding EF-hand superfamily protein